MTGSPTVTAAPAGATGVYTFDNVTGTAVINSSTATVPATNGTLIGTAAISPAGGGINGTKGLANPNESGASGGEMAIGTVATPATNFTFGAGSVWTGSAWFNDLYTPFVGSGTSGTAEYRTLFRQNGGSQDHEVIINTGTRFLGVFDTTFQSSGYQFPASFETDGLWHSIIAVGTGTGATGTVTFYVDGVQVGVVTGHNAGTNIYAVGDYQGGSQVFAKTIDDVSLYPTALTPTQVTALYQSDLRVSNIIPDASAVTIGPAGTLDLNGASETIGSLTGTGLIVNNGGVLATLTVNGGSFGGTIQAVGSGSQSLNLGVASGTLLLNNAALTYGAGVSINTGSTLQLGDGSVPITSLPGGTITDNGTLTFDLPAGDTVASAANIGGSGNVIVIGAGTLGLGGTSSYTGGTTIGTGTTAAKVIITTGTALGTGATSITSLSTLVLNNITSAGAIAMVSGATLAGTGIARENGAITIPASASVTFATLLVGDTLTLGSVAGSITGGAAAVLNVVGAGTTVLPNTEASIPATVFWTVTNSTLSISADTDLGTAPAAPVANFLTLNGGTILYPVLTAAITINTNRGITLSAGGGTFSNTVAAVSTIINYGGLMSGSGPFTKAGTGDFNYTTAPLAVNGVTQTTVAGGRYFYSIGSTNFFGPATSPIVIQSGATLDYNVNTALTLPNPITVQSGGISPIARLTRSPSSGPVTLPTSGTIYFNCDDSTTSTIVMTNTANAIVATGDLTIQVGLNGFATDFPNMVLTTNANIGTVSLNHVISGNVNFTKAGGGNLVLTNAQTGTLANSFGSAGKTITVAGGNLFVSSDAQLGNAGNSISTKSERTHSRPPPTTSSTSSSPWPRALPTSGISGSASSPLPAPETTPSAKPAPMARLSTSI